MSAVLCECGCGEPAPIATRSDRRWGEVKGQARRFRMGHNLRVHLDRGRRNRTHGQTAGGRTPTYLSWMSMKARCLQESHVAFPIYGGRGITICDRWLGPDGFPNFLADMGERPEGKSLDRVDGDGNYEPGNCRWATPKEQARNRRPRTKATA